MTAKAGPGTAPYQVGAHSGYAEADPRLHSYFSKFSGHQPCRLRLPESRFRVCQDRLGQADQFIGPWSL